jgi:hypothetical protein
MQCVFTTPAAALAAMVAAQLLTVTHGDQVLVTAASSRSAGQLVRSTLMYLRKSASESFA